VGILAIPNGKEPLGDSVEVEGRVQPPYQVVEEFRMF